MKETNLIDLEDLKQRSAGKTRLMAMLLDSFIQSSAAQLSALKQTPIGTDQATQLRTLHTLKGLLLEAGAGECAAKLKQMEEQVKAAGQISNDEINDITHLVENVAQEAAELRKGLVV